MLQPNGKSGDMKAAVDARQPTRAFAIEPRLLPTPIIVGDAAHTGARRGQDATLIGLAPPPTQLPSVITGTAATPTAATPTLALQAQPATTASDDRRLAAILVFGTLIAMFSIAFSAMPERGHAGAVMQPRVAVSTQAAALSSVTTSVTTSVPATPAAPASELAASDTPAATKVVTTPRMSPRTKADKGARRRLKANRN